MLCGLQTSMTMAEATKKRSGHRFASVELPPENPEEEKIQRLAIDWQNQHNEPKERQSELPSD